MKNYANLLEGKYAVVTNGGDPGGSAIVKKFAMHGAAVAFGVKDPKTGDRILAEISDHSPQSFYMVLDLAVSEEIEEFCREVKRRFPLTTVLVNNPYGDISKTITGSDEEDDIILLQINQRSVMQTLRAFYGPMRDNRCGSVINISSNTVFKPVSGNPFLTLSMGTMGGLTRTPAFEGGEFYVRINEILSGIRPGQAELSQCPLKVAGSHANGMADVVLFLASDMSSYITGQSLTVDGGARRQLFKRQS
ncbi:MAG TPA: SDR family oxidoreductase [Clostridia bacterium]|nr:SDR family oxidoreductase [Clostridia bacterium]